jgi:hypothetical protein
LFLKFLYDKARLIGFEFCEIAIFEITVLHELKDSKVIEPEFQVLTKKNRLKKVTCLTSNLVSRSKSIFYKEKTNNNYKSSF